MVDNEVNHTNLVRSRQHRSLYFPFLLRGTLAYARKSAREYLFLHTLSEHRHPQNLPTLAITRVSPQIHPCDIGVENPQILASSLVELFATLRSPSLVITRVSPQTHPCDIGVENPQILASPLVELLYSPSRFLPSDVGDRNPQILAFSVFSKVWSPMTPRPAPLPSAKSLIS